MKVCVVGPTYPYRGGIAHYTTLLVNYLREAGHPTRFYSFTRQYPRWLFPGKTDKDPSKATFTVDCEYVLDPLNPLTWWQLYKKIRADAPDLLVFQWWVPYWAPCLTMPSRWVRDNTQIQLAFICHNIVPHGSRNPFNGRIAATALQFADFIIVHSEQDRQHIQTLLPDRTIIKLHLPTYEKLADRSNTQLSGNLRQKLQLAEDQPVVLFFGLVRPYKGLQYLIDALALVLKKRQVHLLAVGEFWVPPETYIHQARRLGVEQHITLVNRYIPNEELGFYFQLADVVVLPYISATQSAVLQLAFGFGKPVIVTHVGGLHEVVQDGVTGLIVPPQDATALAAAIERYFNEELQEPFATNIRSNQVQKDFGWSPLIDALEQNTRTAIQEDHNLVAV